MHVVHYASLACGKNAQLCESALCDVTKDTHPSSTLVTTLPSQGLFLLLETNSLLPCCCPVLVGKLKPGVFARGCKHRAKHGVF